MKIIHCLQHFFPDHVGGTEIYLNALCIALGASGFDAVVVKPSFNKAATTYLHNGIRVVEYLETSLPTAILQTGLVAPDGLANFINVLKNEKPDGVHFHETAGSSGITIYHVKAAADLGFSVYVTFHLPGNICMRDDFLYKGKMPCDGCISEKKCSICLLHKRGLRYGVPEVLTITGRLVQKKIATKGLSKMLNYPLYVQKHKRNLQVVEESCRNVFVSSLWYKKLLVANGFNEKKIIVLPASVTDRPAQTKDQQKELSKEAVVRFVYIGRIASIKGLHFALQALRKSERQNWQFDIYGHVTDERYNRFCRNLSDGEHRIQWKGQLCHDRVSSTLITYDALLFPSVAQETMGLAMLEALAVRLPVIASSVWTVEENIVHGKNGLIFKRGNQADLLEKLETVLENPSQLTFFSKNITSLQDMAPAAKIMMETYREGNKATYAG